MSVWTDPAEQLNELARQLMRAPIPSGPVTRTRRLASHRGRNNWTRHHHELQNVLTQMGLGYDGFAPGHGRHRKEES